MNTISDLTFFIRFTALPACASRCSCTRSTSASAATMTTSAPAASPPAPLSARDRRVHPNGGDKCGSCASRCRPWCGCRAGTCCARRRRLPNGRPSALTCKCCCRAGCLCCSRKLVRDTTVLLCKGFLACCSPGVAPATPQIPVCILPSQPRVVRYSVTCFTYFDVSPAACVCRPRPYR